VRTGLSTRTDASNAFFEAPGGSAGKRRLLLISPRFAPAQDVGSLRWQKMARYVAERGWELDVIAFHPDCVPSPDWTTLTDLPPGTRVYGIRTPVVPLARVIDSVWRLLRKVFSGVQAQARDGTDPGAMRGADRRPDSLTRDEIRWSLTDPRSYVRAYNVWATFAEERKLARQAAALARRIVAPGTHDAIISSGPPHGSYEAARLVSRARRIPFIVDMRDVWSLVQECLEPFASPLLLHLAQRHERRVVEEAALVAANTDVVRMAMMEAYPQARDRILTVMNGFDDDPLPATRHGSQFIVAYAGTIYVDRDPTCLFRAARQVIEELNLSPAQFALKFMGANDRNVSLPEMAAAEGIAEFVHAAGPRPRAQALEFLSHATMLVSLPQNWDMSIPAKLFEYARFDAWLLALAEQNSATALVLRGTDADVVSPGDTRAIAAVLHRRYEQYVTGVRPRRIATDVRLSRRYQAQHLLDAIERCVENRRRTEDRGSRSEPPIHSPSARSC
jgi:glycosyltransferase involved in cell wall biosynthesis